MKIAILGFGAQGKSAYEYWNRDGNEITICDSNPKTEVPSGAKSQLGPDYLKNLEQFDLLVRTPILHPSDIVDANSEDILDKVWSNTNEFFKVCPIKNIIAVTGTKGKGTTSTLIAKILQKSGAKVHLGGNIGIPPLELLNDNIQPDDWVVLELANFQLIDLKKSPHIGVCLMVVPEHLDWHTDIDEYIDAKQQMFMHQTEKDIAIYYAKNENSEDIASASEGKIIPYFAPPGAIIENDDIVIDNQSICSTDELKLLGQHNWQNACAAVTAVWQITKNVDAIREVLTSFTGLPFRIELRKEINGIKYYNDSFATAAGATIAAINSIPENKVLIIGGYDRNLDLKELAKVINSEKSIRKIVLIGASAERFAKELTAIGFSKFEIVNSKDMNEIVKLASNVAQTGDAVVLSPAFASFDMFKNFEDRGIKFNNAVESL